MFLPKDKFILKFRKLYLPFKIQGIFQENELCFYAVYHLGWKTLKRLLSQE